MVNDEFPHSVKPSTKFKYSVINNPLVYIIIILITITGCVIGVVREKADVNVCLNKKIDSLQVYKDRYNHITKIANILSTYPIQGVEPYVYACLVDSVAKKYDIHWEAVVATIDIETGRTWDPTQTSHANCKGIMQFKEQSAEQHAKKIGLPYKKGITVWSEIAIIEIGTSYLAEGIKNHTYVNGFKHYVGGSEFGGVAKALATKKMNRKERTRLTRINNYIIYYNNLVGSEYKKLCLMSGRPHHELLKK